MEIELYQGVRKKVRTYNIVEHYLFRIYVEGIYNYLNCSRGGAPHVARVKVSCSTFDSTVSSTDVRRFS